MSHHSKQSQVAVVGVPLLAQSHLNQMLQFCFLISSGGLPVYYVSTALHNRQAKSRCTAVAQIQFHDLPTPPIASPPPNHNSINKYPTHLMTPATAASLTLRGPFAAYLQELAAKFDRVVVVHDPWMSYVVQDVAQIPNAETYTFVCISAFSSISYFCGFLGLPFPLPHPTELSPFDDWMTEDAKKFATLQMESSANLRRGCIYNTSRVIEPPYMEVIQREELKNNRLTWAIRPLLPTSSPLNENRHKCLEWLDKQEPRSVMYVSFGTTVSLSDEEVAEIAQGLARSRVKFLWVLRDADKCNVFDEDVRRAELPEGFGVGEGEGMVVREWAPQSQILGHPSVGGFMSHCGWNSCMESITMGVAIAAWPMHSDQPRNAALVVDILKTGILVREWKDRLEVVKASTVENAVTRLMASEEGDRIRKAAEELGAAVRESMEPGGASQIDLDSFIAHITR